MWAKTDKGLKRDSNQDSFLVDQDLGLFVVADGMGGHSGGEVASQMAVAAVQAFAKEYDGKVPDGRDLVRMSYEDASRKIFDRATHESPELAGMGTTMVVLYIKGNTVSIGNVGDSRCYLFRDGNLWQLTEDHSLVNEQLRSGLITEAQMKTMTMRNVITRSVGYERVVEVDVLQKEVQAGDCFLICSDGLSGLVTDHEIQQILSQGVDAAAVDRCIERALKQGGVDNVTVLVVRVDKV